MIHSDIEQKSVGEFNLRVIVQFHLFLNRLSGRVRGIHSENKKETDLSCEPRFDSSPPDQMLMVLPG